MYLQKKSGCDKVVLYAQTFPLSEIKQSFKGFPHVSKMTTHTVSRVDNRTPSTNLELYGEH